MVRKSVTRLTQSVMLDLGSLPGGNHSHALAINDSGQVVGQAETVPGGPWHAFLYAPGSGMKDLGTLTGDIKCSSCAHAINNSGQVVGWSEIAPGGQRHTFLFDPGSGMQDLGKFLGDINCYSSANDINDNGQVAGEWCSPRIPMHAFLYTPGRGMKDLHTSLRRSGIASWYSSRAWGINNNGKVAGECAMFADQSRGFLYTPPPRRPRLGMQVQVLGTLSGYDGDHRAMAINDMDQVAGIAYADDISGLPRRAFLFDKGKLIDLGTGNDSSQAHDINQNGIVVGGSWTPRGERAFFYKGGKIVEIGTLGGASSWAYGINNKGEVVGRSGLGDGRVHAFLYKP